jgi:hypothetical protein
MFTGKISHCTAIVTSMTIQLISVNLEVVIVVTPIYADEKFLVVTKMQK